MKTTNSTMSLPVKSIPSLYLVEIVSPAPNQLNICNHLYLIFSLYRWGSYFNLPICFFTSSIEPIWILSQHLHKMFLLLCWCVCINCFFYTELLLNTTVWSVPFPHPLFPCSHSKNFGYHFLISYPFLQPQTQLFVWKLVSITLHIEIDFNYNRPNVIHVANIKQ